MSIDPGILQDLKKMVILTGEISSVHEKTLKTAPFIFFDDLAEVSLSYDIKTSADASTPGLGSRISYTLSLPEDISSDPILDKRVDALKKTVQALLWDDVEISIFDKSGRDLCLIAKSKK